MTQTVFGEALAKAIEKKNETLRCVDCGHKQVIHLVAATGKKTVTCLGNNRKCKCRNAPPFMSQLI